MPVSINGSSGLTGVAAIDSVSSTELGYLDGLTEPLTTSLAAKLDTPVAWTGYSPSTGGITAGTGLPSGAYIRIGRTVIFWAQLGVTPSTTYTGSIWIGLPFTANNQYAFQATQYNGTTGLFYPIWCYASGNAAELFAVNAASTYGSLEYANSTKPSAISGTTSRFYISGSYEVA